MYSTFMPRATPQQLIQTTAEFKRFLARRGDVVLDDATGRQYFCISDVTREDADQLRLFLPTLRIANVIETIPYINGMMYTFFDPSHQHTVSPSHVRLPKLSHLITLTEQDFFSLFDILENSKPTNNNALTFHLPTPRTPRIPESLIPYFDLLKTNYRMNQKYADRKWTPRTVFSKIAALPVTRESQLSAMQYLTALQNQDLFYFPIEAAVDLELDTLVDLGEGYSLPPAPDEIGLADV